MIEVTAAGALQYRNLMLLPVVPGRIEFALRARRFLLAERPKVVAVELPSDLQSVFSRALGRLPQMSVIVVAERQNDEEESASYIVIEPGDPFIEALRTAREIGAEIVFLEPPGRDKPHVPGMYPDPHSLEIIGIQKYVEAYRNASGSAPAHSDLKSHAAAMAWKLQGADPFVSTAVVLSLNMLNPLLREIEIPQEEPPPARISLFSAAELFNLHPDCLAEVTLEAPYYQALYEGSRAEGAALSFDRLKSQLALLRDAEKEYVINTGDQIRGWQRIGLARFSRNLALIDRNLIPGVYDLTLAARSIVDDNYAYEVWQMANRYSEQQTEDPPLETLNISGEEIWLRTRKLRLRRRLPRLKQRLKPVGLKSRKREKFKGEWATQTNSESICSYPPEDIVIENYGRFLKQYAKNVVSEERSRVEPFLTSMRDGIDLRETIRNWHEGKLYVRELGKFSGDIGALIIIFDEDRADRYQYLTTWQGEHQNESDMAFYSTYPFEHLVGPGIGRAEYGGLLMTLPPRRLYDVWNDFDYDAAETKAERLLMAGLDYAMERHVVYAAARPPRSMFRQLEARLNRKIVYLPLGQLSPAKLKKIRVVHVLDSHSRRADAKQFIW